MAKAIASLNPGNEAAEEKPSRNLRGPCIHSIRVMHFVSGPSVQNHSGVDTEGYNKTWLVARHGYKTPDQVRTEQLSVAKAIIAELPLAA
jgi:hypothetical protein